MLVKSWGEKRLLDCFSMAKCRDHENRIGLHSLVDTGVDLDDDPDEVDVGEGVNGILD